MRRPEGDTGSLVLSLLAMLVISSVLLVVAATVVMGQKQSRFDRNYEQALQVSEVGLSQMTSLIQSTPNNSAFAPMSGSTTDGGSYVVSAIKTSPYVWTATATGTAASGVRRTVQNEVWVRPLFSLAAFGRVSVTFNGGNGADSFDSALGTDICLNGSSGVYANPGTPTSADPSQTNVNMCRTTGIGSAATNGALDLKGGVEERINYAEIFNARERIDDPLPDATGYCSSVPAICNMYNQGRLVYHREPIELPLITSCNAPGTESEFAGTGTLGSRVYKFSNATLTGNTTVAGTVTSPTILCVSGRLTVASQHLVNFQQLAGRWVPRRPGTLLIFVTGESNASVSMGNNASISAAIFAPHAVVDCGPQGNVYGSLIANSINNQGGWNFHYDEALAAQVSNAPVRVRNWREVGAGA